MQSEILDKNPSAELKVYAVWFSMLSSDARSRWPDDLLTDPRVVHLWDGSRETGRWFAKNEDFYLPIAWDVYYLYGPKAHWDDVPGPLLSSGSTVLYRKDNIRRDLAPFIEAGESSS